MASREISNGRSNIPNVLLMSMPWAPVYEPSLGLAILKSQLIEAGIPTRVRHCSPFLLEYLKFESYEALGARYGCNDFLFTSIFEGDEISAEQIETIRWFVHNDYNMIALQRRAKLDPVPFIDYVRRVRNEIIPHFLNNCLRVVDEICPTMVGFTCMFDQTLASLALAKKIKEKYPDTLVVLGGYALESPVGPQVIRCFPFVDTVLQGEGEDRIVALARASLDRRELQHIHGIDYRSENGSLNHNPRTGKPIDLDKSPFPNYDDFYTDVAELSSEHSIDVDITTLPVESSRGCWWGQVHHCVFCGIDGETMKYRSKSAANVEKMLDFLAAKCGDVYFRFSDYILPRSYYKTLLPRLAERERKYKLHWEMKANVKVDEILLMKNAGVKAVQPGIESFSTPVLQAMDKGVTGIQNVLTIKLLTQYDFVVYYNVLFGFPNERPEFYEDMLKQIPLLYHLPPPFSYVPVQMTRYAPLHSDPERFGIDKKMVADKAYEMIFSRKYREQIGFNLDDYAYVFATPYDFDPRCSEFYGCLVYQISNWADSHLKRDVRLSYELTESGVCYRDSRYQREEQMIDCGEVHARVQELISERIFTIEELIAVMNDVPRKDTLRVVEELDAGRVIYREGNRLVGLALPIECYKRWSVRATLLDEKLMPA